jgi:hypothetical protein
MPSSPRLQIVAGFAAGLLRLISGRQELPNCAQQFLIVHGLLTEDFGARIAHALLVGLTVPGGKHDDGRRLRRGYQLSQYEIAIFTGQAQVQDDQVRPAGSGLA